MPHPQYCRRQNASGGEATEQNFGLFHKRFLPHVVPLLPILDLPTPGFWTNWGGGAVLSTSTVLVYWGGVTCIFRPSLLKGHQKLHRFKCGTFSAPFSQENPQQKRDHIWA